jgi:hypothetical protein
MLCPLVYHFLSQMVLLSKNDNLGGLYVTGRLERPSKFHHLQDYAQRKNIPMSQVQSLIIIWSA